MALFDNEGNEITPIVGTEGNDNFILVDSDKTLDLLAGNDILVVIGDNNTISGGSGNDDLTDDGTGTGNIFDGGSGNDSLFGGTSGTLDGGTGRDVIFASPNGQGGNTISGGTGRDLFYIATGEIPGLVDPTNPGTPLIANTITDFQIDLDYLVLSLAPGLTLFNQLVITETDGDTTISFDDTNDNVVNPKPIAILEGIEVTEANVVILTPENPNVPPLPNVAPVVDEATLQFVRNPLLTDIIGT
jgi:Ca2+-binding RTX toxin-like protein